MPAEQLTWYAARAGGLVAYALVTAAVIAGLLLTSRAPAGRSLVSPRPLTSRPLTSRAPRGLVTWRSRAWVLDLHRFLGGLACAFTGVHLLAVLADDHEQFGLVELLVPLTATYRPVAVAWGIVAFYLLLAVELTSLVRGWLPHALWRRVHLTSLPLFVLSTVHLLTAGTDGDHPLAVAGAVLASVLVTVLGLARLLRPPRPARVATADPQRRSALRKR